MVCRRQIVEAARAQLGVRWVHQGRKGGVGLDCLGLVVHVARECGFSPEDTTAYDRRPNTKLLFSEIQRQFVQIPMEQAKAGSVVLIHFNQRTRNPYHFGILTGEGTMVHGYAVARKTVEHPVEKWEPNFHSAFDFPGVED